jgi:hypothetical protein
VSAETRLTVRQRRALRGPKKPPTATRADRGWQSLRKYLTALQDAVVALTGAVEDRDLLLTCSVTAELLARTWTFFRRALTIRQSAYYAPCGKPKIARTPEHMKN